MKKKQYMVPSLKVHKFNLSSLICSSIETATLPAGDNGSEQLLPSGEDGNFHAEGKSSGFEEEDW